MLQNSNISSPELCNHIHLSIALHICFGKLQPGNCKSVRNDKSRCGSRFHCTKCGTRLTVDFAWRRHAATFPGPRFCRQIFHNFVAVDFEFETNQLNSLPRINIFSQSKIIHASINSLNN